MGSISFKSVGTTQKQSSLVSSPTPFGIKTPLQLSTTDGLLVMSYTLAEQVKDNLRNLLLTNWGERLGLYNFGANLRPLATEFTTLDNFENAAIQRIHDAVSRWMPYVELDRLESVVDHMNNKNTAVIRTTVVYDVPKLGIKSEKVEVTIYAVG